MAGFNWNQYYTTFKVKLEKAVTCTVGRYVTPKPSQFPYCDISLSDNSGSGYDLQGNEGAQNPMLTISVYCNGASADSTCESISMEAKKIMLSYGFQCRYGPIPVTNADPSISRWVARYQRIFGGGDELRKLN